MNVHMTAYGYVLSAPGVVHGCHRMFHHLHACIMGYLHLTTTDDATARGVRHSVSPHPALVPTLLLPFIPVLFLWLWQASRLSVWCFHPRCIST